MTDTPSSERPPDVDDHRHTADLVRGALTSLVGKLAIASRQLSVLLISNFLGSETLGFYRSAWQVVWIGFKVTRFGFHRSIARAVVERRADDDAAGWQSAIGKGMLIGLSTGLLSAAFIFAFAPHIAAFLGDPTLVHPLRIMAWALPFLGPTSVCLASLRSLRIIKYDVYVNSIGGPMIVFVGAAITIAVGLGMIGLSLTQTFMGAGMLVLALSFFTRHYDVRGCLRHLRDATPSWVSLIRFSFPVMLSDLINTLVVSIDMLLVFRFEGKEAAGIYFIARQISTVMRKAPQAFDPVLGPIIADLTYRRQERALSDELAFLLRWILTINVAYLAGFYLIGGRLLLIYGPEFPAGAPAAWVLCLGMLIFALSIPMESLLIMSGHPRASLFNNAIWLASATLLCFWLIPEYGIMGAAWSSTASLILVSFARLVQSYRLLHLNPFRWQQLKPLAAGLIGILATILFKYLIPLPPLWSLVPELVIFTGSFFLTLYLLGLHKRDRMLIDRMRKKLGGKKNLPTIPPETPS